MANTNMRRGFTMIELIFVIVIIGILAAVAIPKLAANRDDAEAATCVHEVGQLVNEIGGYYTKKGNSVFTTATISDMSNIGIIATTGSTKGIATDAVVHGATGITYNCDSTLVATITGKNAGSDYNLSVLVPAVAGTDSPAVATAKADIAKNMSTTPGTAKVFSL